jgi:hypothetical protein
MGTPFSDSAELDGLPERFHRGAGRDELVGHVAREVEVGQRGGDGAVVEFLAVIQFVAAGHPPGMKVTQEVDVVADGPDHIAFHDLHVIDVIQQFDPGRVDTPHDLHPEGGVIALVVGVVHLAVQQFHTNRDSLLLGQLADP